MKMKPLAEIGLQISEKEYRDIDYISSSFLSDLSRKGSNILLDSFDGNDGTMFGTIVDDYICGTHNKNNYYTVPEEFNVGTTLKSAIDEIFKIIDHNSVRDTSEYYKRVVEVLNTNNIPYYDKKEPEWRAKKILEEGGKYFESLVLSRGKITVPFNLYNKAILDAENILNNPFTSDIFKLKDHQEGVFQFKFIFNYLGKNMKGMIDWLVVDHKEKTIEPYDIKTGSEITENFEKSFYHWRYDIQALLYTIICKTLAKRWFSGYKVKPFTFIYSSRNDSKVLKFEIDKTHLIGARDGYERFGYKKYKGVKQLLSDLEWYKINSFKVDHDKDVYDANGLVKLKPLEL